MKATSVFNSPNSLFEKAQRLGLYLTTWAPGDGVTRYRFHEGVADYDDGTEICTVLGRKDAHTWLNGYGWALELQRRRKVQAA